MQGKFLSEYDLFIPNGNDSIYLVDRFKHGFGIVFDKSEITLSRLNDGKYDTKNFGKSGLIDSKGNWILPLEADAIVIYNSRFARIKNGKFYRLFDLVQQKYISKEYDLISPLPNNYFEVELADMKGIINENGREIIPLEYSLIVNFTNKEFISVLKDGKYGALDLNGNEILPVQYEFISGLGDRMIVKEMDGCILMNTKGEMLVDEKFEHVQLFLTYDLVSIKDGEKYRIYDLSKKEFVTEGFDEFYTVSTDPKGFYRFYDKGYFGVLDSNFQYKIQPKFSSISVFKNGFATIEINGKHGYVNSNFEIIIPIEFDKVSHFFDGLALVEKDGRRGFINTNGEFVFEIGKQNIGFFHSGLARKVENNLVGFIDKSGKEIIPVQFEWADDFEGNSILVHQNEKVYFVNQNGDQIKA